MGWLFSIAVVIVAMVFYNKLNDQLAQLHKDVTKLKLELRRQKDSLNQLKSSHSATPLLSNTTALTTSTTSEPSQSITSPRPTADTSRHDFTTNVLDNDNQAAVQVSATETDMAHANTPIAPVAAATSSIAFVNPTKPETQPQPQKHSAPIIEPDEQSLPIVTSLFNSLQNWFLGGNLVVRVGVIVLLIGVVLLLRLLSDYIEMSIASKLIAVGVIGLGLAVLGLKLVNKRFAYGITVQGTGLSIAYLTAFFAYSVYHVLSSLPSFIMLGVLSAVTIGLAVRQNAFPLALLALSGGFFAPLLTATDSSNLVALFSYYLLLNITVAIIAHYRTWKVLNILGVAVTFGLAYYFGIENLVTDIESNRTSLVWLVALHLALYLFVAVRYTQQIIAYNIDNEAHNISSTATNPKPVSSLYLYPIDIGLLFSVPVLAFGLFALLLYDIEHALTITSAVLAAIYLGLGWLLIRHSQRYTLLTEGMLALGVGFLALVIPLALDADWIAFGWSIQGLALVWFGRRSLRAWSVLFGLLLQIISILMLIITLFFALSNYPTLAISISALAFLTTMFILRSSNSPAASYLTDSASANRQTEQESEQNHTDSMTSYAKDLGVSASAAHQWFDSVNKTSLTFSMVWRSPNFITLLTLIAMVWALYVGIANFEQWFSTQQVATTTLIALAALLSVSTYWLVNRYRSWDEMRQLSQGLLVLFYAALILQLPQKFEFAYEWNSVNWTLFIVLIMGWLVVGQLWLKTWCHHKQLSRFDSAIWLATGVLVLTAAVHYGLPDSQGVMTILIPVALMLTGLYFGTHHDKFTSINDIDAHENTHSSNQQAVAYWFDWQQALLDCAKIFVPVTLIWVVITNWFYDGVIWNLPYFPLFNLYDISLWIVVIYGLGVIYLTQQNSQHAIKTIAIHKNPTTKPLLVILGLISFWIISSMLVRTLNAFIGTPVWSYQPMSAWDSEQVQTGLTILWTLIALVATIISSRQSKRTPWFMGIGLLGVVVLKLVLVDLSQTEAIWRVVSFLVAGSLILLIGYLAPLPPEEAETIHELEN